MNYYRRYVGDYLKKTIRLTMAGHGAYGLMLDFYYAEEKPLPLDMDDVYAIARAVTEADRAVVDKVLAAYFHRKPDGYHNLRADQEVAIGQATTRKQRESGLASAKLRWGDGSTDTEGHGSAVQPPSTNHQPPAFNLQPPSEVKSEGAALPLPAWLNAETWKEWLKIRKSKTNTPGALKAALTRLEKFKNAGHDPNEILASSLANGWQGLFEPDPRRAGTPGGKQAQLEAHNAAVAKRFVERGNEPE